MSTRNQSSRTRGLRNAQHGVALITPMPLLLLLRAMSLTMVLSVSSDMLLTGYYGNYRGAFYAADSGVNLARQQIVASLNGSIPANFDPTVSPMPANATSNAQSAGASGYSSFATVS